MPHALVFDVDAVLPFVQGYLPGLKWTEGVRAIGLSRGGELVAGVIFEGFNCRNIWMHVAAVPGARWMTRKYLQACFLYPFNVAKVDRVSGYVDASNAAARRFNEHLGFEQEAVLTGAASDGGDVIFYVMWRADCRFLES